MNRKKLLLAALVGVLLLSLGYAFWKSPRQERVASSSPKKQESSTLSAEEGLAGSETRLKLELLQSEKEEFKGFSRNIFQPPGPVKPPVPAIVAAPPPPPPPPPPPAVNFPAPPRETTRFSLIGYLQQAGEKVVFLGLGNEIFIAREGERFGRNQEFMAVKLTREKLVVQKDGEVNPIVIPLLEGKTP